MKKQEEVKYVSERIQNTTKNLDSKDHYFDDFKWFSKVNYTTTTEYFGELKLFLEEITDKNYYLYEEYNLMDVYEILVKIFK